MTLTIPNATIAARFKVAAVDADGILRSATLQAKISDYAHAYVAKAADGQIYVQPNAAVFPTTPGSSFSLNVQISGTDAAGNALPVLQLDVVLQGPPPPPNATQIVVSSGPEFNDTFPVPADPGSDTISL